jgi:uncharacterized RmlC-like cupin family protein
MPAPYAAGMPVLPTVTVVRPERRERGRQGVDYFHGISAESAGAQRICAHLVVIPPGGRAKAHLHAGHESVIYVVSGTVVTWYGEGLTERAVTDAGDFLYLPAGVPHLPVNVSATQPAVGLVARTDPNEQESVVPLPELDDLPHTRAQPLG